MMHYGLEESGHGGTDTNATYGFESIMMSTAATTGASAGAVTTSTTTAAVADAQISQLKGKDTDATKAKQKSCSTDSKNEQLLL